MCTQHIGRRRDCSVEERPAAVYRLKWEVNERKEKKNKEVVVGGETGCTRLITQTNTAGRIKTAQINEFHVTGSVKNELAHHQED